MFYSKKSIGNFLLKSKTLIYGVDEDDFIKQRILPYNFDQLRITECVVIYNEAEKAESVKLQEFGEQLEARVIFEQIMEEAETEYKKNKDFLKLVVRDNPEKQEKLFLKGIPRSQKISDVLISRREVYEWVLSDDEVVQGMSRFGITREALEGARQKVIDAETAKRKYDQERGEAQDATLLRNDAFKKLSDVVDELETVLLYALEDRPQLMEKLGIPVLSPGYKRKEKTTPQPEEPDQSTDDTEVPQQ